MQISVLKEGVFQCTCGCGNAYPRIDGEALDGATKLLFRCVLMQHEPSFPHLWLGIVTGPWFDDEKDCWVNVHMWRNEADVETRIEDFADTPWSDEDILDCRPLDRLDVLRNEGALPWFIEFAQQITATHKPFGRFLINDIAI